MNLCNEGFSVIDEWSKGPPSPRPSPQGRGGSNVPYRCSSNSVRNPVVGGLREVETRSQTACRRLRRLATILPLPGGEGRGESGRHSIIILRFALAVGFLFFINSTPAANLPTDWQREQRMEIPASGLAKLSLPLETLDAARGALEDLRLYDDAGNELPYLIQRPVPVAMQTQAARAFRTQLSANHTTITFDIGFALPIDAVTLETPATSFIKPVKIEGSTDGRTWRTLAEGQPIFRQANGASQLRLALPAETWRSLRLTVDDQRSQPIPFTGARVHAAEAEPTPTENFPVTITERHENPGETRLTLNLGAANLDVTSLRFETDEPLFQRQLTFAVPQVAEDSIREHVLGHDTIYRVALDGQVSAASLTAELESRVHSRELLVLIRNEDSPPIAIKSVTAQRRPVYLVFFAKSAGGHHLLTGNPRCAAPRYDLASLGANLKSAPVVALKLAPLADNPSYREPEALADVELTGSTLDVSTWRYRKALKLLHTGAQQLELDLEVLAHAQPGFADLRLMRADRQVPYIIERTSITRTLTPTVTASTDPKDPKRSHWTLKLPQAGLPVTRLSCATRTILFERTMVLYELVDDERGVKYQRNLGSATWVLTPERKSRELSLSFDTAPLTDTLMLTTVNGDNPAIEIENFRVFHPATRILFKAKSDDDLLLYYGNSQAAPPRYDLSLVANQLLAAQKSVAIPVAEQQLKKSAWGEGHAAGRGGVVFWGILAVVVIGLLFVIARLLPKAPQP